jgi:hypothetical protein
MLYVFAGFFGVHGWPFGTTWTLILFVVTFAVLRYCTMVDIFAKITVKWPWAFMTFRFGITPGPDGWRYITTPCPQCVCPGPYVCGVIAVYCCRTLSLPPGISKIACFLGNKSFMLHLLDSVMVCFGSRMWNSFRPSERISQPTRAIIGACLCTVQTFLLGIFLEVYRERLFTSAFALISWAMKSVASHSRLSSSMSRQMKSFRYPKENTKLRVSKAK